MKTVNILNVTFKGTINYSEVELFRKGIIKRMGIEDPDWSGRINDGEKFTYRYPVIQYKRHNSKPAITFVGQGIKKMPDLFEENPWVIELGNRYYNLEVDKMELDQYALGVTDVIRHYNLRNWMALNQSNYPTFRKLEKEQDKKQFLEKILAANLLGLATGLEYKYPRKFSVKISHIQTMRLKRMNEVDIETYDIRFSTDLLIPPFLGIGKSAAKGFGLLSRYEKWGNQPQY